ncbi:hypothetical protein QWI17_11810 [Gilvimarinus sp. SDUM040013]|uniref:Aminomethyltransferase folate-binding domain-containing protein n=1 Tax=Gilvimarinus gilvus TaxID=3058038 RepID=A0ABU4RW55_9GAMM|nr:hypothetical protein [Gilvimarinus sp. SDUM040013]MDO3386521.1 hypothetical protein [Gilvimarinus sp. SDUM040013]MDX6849097.1 hypothetical protein [Gilvimarinus sp. SDUM040013]
MSHWQAFLEDQGAHIYPDGAADFPPDDTSPNALCHLGTSTLVTVTGPDAIKFLQGQVTCDLRELTPMRWLRGAQCNLKGRVTTSFAVAQLDQDTLLLRCATDLVEPFVKGLEKYAVFSKVTIRPAPDWHVIGVCGINSAEVLAETTGLRTSEAGGLAINEQALALQHNAELIEVWVHDNQAQPLWQQLTSCCSRAPTHCWLRGQIDAGCAEISAATSELFTPQDLNYPELGAVSFKKGCYTGQEVVARLHYKGKLKKHLYPIEFAADTSPAPGCELADESGKSRGHLVQAAPVQDTLYRGLAVLPDDESVPLYIGKQPQRALRLKLPYDINS